MVHEAYLVRSGFGVQTKKNCSHGCFLTTVQDGAYEICNIEQLLPSFTSNRLSRKLKIYSSIQKEKRQHTHALQMFFHRHQRTSEASGSATPSRQLRHVLPSCVSHCVLSELGAACRVAKRDCNALTQPFSHCANARHSQIAHAHTTRLRAVFTHTTHTYASAKFQRLVIASNFVFFWSCFT